MNEEIEYAEMLEIPVSTVNVVRKKRAKKRKEQPVELKETLIAQVNEKLSISQEIQADAALFAESVNSEGDIRFDDIPQRIDTVRLYGTGENVLENELHAQEYLLNEQKDGGRYETKAQKAVRITLTAEFALACALCGTIFLTNVFLPGSAINTFFRALNGNVNAAQIDERKYSDFKLTNIISERSDAQLSLSAAGILSFTDECCVYPTADGTVRDVVRNADGSYTLTIAHSDSFSGTIQGLDQVYYSVGDSVKANVPVGFTDGTGEVQVALYSFGELLNCLTLGEDNILTWLEQS